MQQVIAIALAGLLSVIGSPCSRQVQRPVAPADSVYLQIIVVKPPEGIDSLMALLRSGENFAELARKHSAHSTASGGGVWGPVRLNELPEAARAQIEKAAEGELIQFFDPALGYAILKKISQATARKIDFQFAF